MSRHKLSHDIRLALWGDIAWVVTAHVVMLRDQEIIDEGVLAAVLTALDSVQRSVPSDDAGTLSEIVAACEAHLESLLPPGAGGAALVGRGRDDTEAAVARMALRRGLLDLAASAVRLREVLIHLAGEHAATTMPAFAGGQAVQPTTFGHYLGGILGPLERVARLIQTAYECVNQSPLGAVALASTSLPIDRERTSLLAGFAKPVPNTFDAVAAADYLLATVAAAAATVAPVRRFLAELLTWLRAEPEAVQVADRWRSQDPSLPQLNAPQGIRRLLESADGEVTRAEAVVSAVSRVEYGPLGGELDRLLAVSVSMVSDVAATIDRTTELLGDGFDVNRAYLANRAGRGHTTSSDLAIFLMEAEGLSPADATAIAGMTVRRALGEGIEASGITVAMIDASAMLIIGRELQVEFEAISRYLAPRRFLERRTATGGPAPAATRQYLTGEQNRLIEDMRWREIARNRLDDSRAELVRISGEALSAVD